MPRDRTLLEKAAGKLILAIQKEWTAEMGEPKAGLSEAAMYASHSLLRAASASGSISGVVGRGSVSEFLGQDWVDSHLNVLPAIRALEACAWDAPE